MLSPATKVLVVDEHRDVRAWIADVLLEHAYDVRTAQCGLEALDQMAVWTPDVLVTDIRMARMTGLELMLRVRQAQRAIGIVAMSEMATARDAAVATQLGADRFLLKPLARPELLAAIESARDVPERVRPRQLAVPAATSMRTADDRSARARRSSVRTVTRRWSPSSLPFVRLTARRS